MPNRSPNSIFFAPLSKHLGRTPWVDRRGELERLLHLTQVMQAGRNAGIVVIYGDEGSGKSRLVYAFQQTLRDQETNITWLSTRCDPDQNGSLAPLVVLLERLFQQSPFQTHEEILTLFF